MARTGFRKEPTLYRLKFEDEDLNGLEVTTRSLGLREFLAITRMSGNPEKQDELFELFCNTILVDWNIEDEDGHPVPATIEGMLDQEISLANSIIQQWQEAVASVPKNSKRTSSSGDSSLEASLPVETL